MLVQIQHIANIRGIARDCAGYASFHSTVNSLHAHSATIVSELSGVYEIELSGSASLGVLRLVAKCVWANLVIWYNLSLPTRG